MNRKIKKAGKWFVELVPPTTPKTLGIRGQIFEVYIQAGPIFASSGTEFLLFSGHSDVGTGLAPVWMALDPDQDSGSLTLHPMLGFAYEKTAAPAGYRWEKSMAPQGWIVDGDEEFYTQVNDFYIRYRRRFDLE